MTTLSLSHSRSPAVTAAGVVGFAVATALAAQVAVPIPGTPVPIVLTPMAVVLAGLWLGPRAGAASMLLYLLAGAVGLPVFAPMGAPGFARFAGPTGGYLMAYPVAAFLAGWLAGDGRTLTRRAVAALAGIVAILAGGLVWLAVLNHRVARALALGVTPFVALDVVKAVLAGVLAPRRAPPPAD